MTPYFWKPAIENSITSQADWPIKRTVVRRKRESKSRPKIDYDRGEVRIKGRLRPKVGNEWMRVDTERSTATVDLSVRWPSRVSRNGVVGVGRVAARLS